MLTGAHMTFMKQPVSISLPLSESQPSSNIGVYVKRNVQAERSPSVRILKNGKA